MPDHPHPGDADAACAADVDTTAAQPMFAQPQNAQAADYPAIGLTPALGGPQRSGTAISIRVRPRTWAALAVTVVVVGIGAIAIFSSESNNAQVPNTPQHLIDRDGGAGGSSSTQTRSESVPQRQAAPPPILREPDPYGRSCDTGFSLPGKSGWATRSGRGAAGTSCEFAQNVLYAYWEQNSSPSAESRIILAYGSVPCPSTGDQCSGDRFVMHCAALGSDSWITCTGGRDGRVYLY
ncbi:hypothetical protein L2K20_20485 [Mycobacterium sp. MBM]|nr:hypothetical protein [Mycobacterium sp. MBM]